MLHNEKELITRIIRGETELFSRIAEYYAPAVHTLIIGIVGSDEDAEELTQDVLLRVYERLTMFNFRSEFSTWLYRIAYNYAISFTRRKRYKHYHIEESRLRMVDDESLLQMEDMADNDDKLEALRSAINLLDAEDRALVTLFYYEERSVAECAEIIMQSQSNIKVRLHRIRKKLYILLTDGTK